MLATVRRSSAELKELGTEVVEGDLLTLQATTTRFSAQRSLPNMIACS